MRTVTLYRGGLDPTKHDTVDYRFTRRSYGGWNVVRADNGRDLGWLTEHREGS